MDQPSKPINQFQGRNSIIQGRLRIQLGQAHAGKKAITLTAADLSGDVKISCTLTGSGATYGSITVDENMYASHTPGGLDANDVFAIANGELKVTTSRGEMYALQDGEVKGAGAKLNGTITAQSRLFASQPEDVVEFAYNHDGLRTQKKVTRADGTVETTDYILHGKLLTHLRRGNDEMHFFYDGEGKPSFVCFNNNMFYYIYNKQGDVIGMADNTGLLVVQYVYDAWGNVTNIVGKFFSNLGELNPFRYRGYVFEEDVYLYYLQNRFFNSEFNRFINADVYCGYTGYLFSHSSAVYCNNNPIGMKDDNGNSALAIGGAVAASGPVGWFLCGLLVLGMIIIVAECAPEITTSFEYAKPQAISISTSNTKTLSDTKSRLTTKSVYYLSYVTEQGGLAKIGKGMTLRQALISLGFSGAINSLNQSFTYDRSKSSDAQRELEHKGSGNWGIYTHDQAHAKALASIVGANQPPEVHSTGMYGHYHDSTHTFHIWYGGVISY